METQCPLKKDGKGERRLVHSESDQPSPLARHPISGPPTSPDRLCPARVGSDGHTPTLERTCPPPQGSHSVMCKPTYAGLPERREGAVPRRNGLFHLAGGR